MRFTTKTEYGIVCMNYMARHEKADRFTIKELSQQESYPPAYLEKILQILKHAGLVVSQQGSGGGYALAKKPSEITLKQIIDALEGGTFEVFCEPEVREDIVCTHFCLCGVKPIWRTTKKLLDDFYGSITLEMMARTEIENQKLLQGSRP